MWRKKWFCKTTLMNLKFFEFARSSSKVIFFHFRNKFSFSKVFPHPVHASVFSCTDEIDAKLKTCAEQRNSNQARGDNTEEIFEFLTTVGSSKQMYDKCPYFENNYQRFLKNYRKEWLSPLSNVNRKYFLCNAFNIWKRIIFIVNTFDYMRND